MTFLSPKQSSFELPWTWCSRCQRAYITSTARVVQFHPDALHPHPSRLTLCPYYDCSSSTKRYGWAWPNFQMQHPQYPHTPQRDVVYQL